MTTTIIKENSKGDFLLASALSAILTELIYLVTLAQTLIQRRKKEQ